MSKWIFVVCLSLCAYVCEAASQKAFVYPTLPVQGATVGQFIPAGWHLVRSAHGDLNGDARPDVAAVLAMDGTVLDAKEDPDTHYRPQLLCMLFVQPGGGLSRSAQTAALLPFDETNIDDDGDMQLAITRGTLVVRITEPHGVSWWHGRTTARFRYQSRDWYLTGITQTVFHAGSGAQRIIDYNLLTGKMRVTDNSLNKKVRAHVQWSTPGKRRVTLAQYERWHAQWRIHTDDLPQEESR